MTTGSRLTTRWAHVGPRARDIAFVIIALLAAVAQALAVRRDGWLVWLPVLVVGLVGTVALWWRRSHPVVVTLVGIPVYAVTTVPVTLAVGLFSLAVRRRDRVLALLTLASAAAFAAVATADRPENWIGYAAIGLIEAGFLAAAGAYVGARRDLLAALRERAARAEEQQELRAEQATLGERARIAREMHDVLAHKVSLIAMHAGALEVNAGAGPEQVRETAGLIRTTAREAMEDLRDVLGVLRPGAADGTDLMPQPRRADIERVVAASRAAGVQAELMMAVDELPDVLARTAHRIVQEALTNVHKHARGAATAVTVTGGETAGLTVEVVNRRPVGGGALLPGSGAGLVGLRERIMLLGGTLECGPCADGGWRLVAWLPWVPVTVAGVSGGPP